MSPDSSETYRVFSIEEIENERGGKAWHEFLRTPDLYSGLYVLKKGATDEQTPHENDEVYYVLKGKAQIELGADKLSKDVRQGAVIFVQAGEQHRFHRITEDLHLLVFFATAESK